MVGVYLDYLERTPLSPMKKSPRKPKSAPIARSIKVHLNPSQQRLVILLSFGSLTDTSKTWKTPAEVCPITGVKRQSQNSIIKRWLQRGQKVISHAKNAGRKRVLSMDQQMYLANPKTRQTMRHLSLGQRAEELKQLWNLPTLGKETLRRYYLRLGVHFKKPPLFYDTKTAQAAFILSQ